VRGDGVVFGNDGTSLFELGYKTPAQRAGSNYTLVAADRGKSVQASANGLTFTVNNAVFSAGAVVSIFIGNGASLTIAQGAGMTLQWAGNGASTGSRTLTGAGIATLLFASGECGAHQWSGPLVTGIFNVLLASGAPFVAFTQTFTTSQSPAIPPGATTATMEGFGDTGAGGGGFSSGSGTGAGGGSGGYNKSSVPVSGHSGQTFTLTIGTGGASVTAGVQGNGGTGVTIAAGTFLRHVHNDERRRRQRRAPPRPQPP